MGTISCSICCYPTAAGGSGFREITEILFYNKEQQLHLQILQFNTQVPNCPILTHRVKRVSPNKLHPGAGKAWQEVYLRNNQIPAHSEPDLPDCPVPKHLQQQGDFTLNFCSRSGKIPWPFLDIREGKTLPFSCWSS